MFVEQKNEQKYATITQHASRKKVWAAIMIRILLYPNTGLDTDIDTFNAGAGKLEHIQPTDVSGYLKTVVTIMGKVRLGFDASRVGTHLICAREGGAATRSYYMCAQAEQKNDQGQFFTVPTIDSRPASQNREQYFRLARNHESYWEWFQLENLGYLTKQISAHIEHIKDL